MHCMQLPWPARCDTRSSTICHCILQYLVHSLNTIQVLDLSSSDEDEDLLLSSRQPLAPRSAPGAAAVRPPLAFRRFEGPLEIDLAAEEDVCCLVRTFRGWVLLAGRWRTFHWSIQSHRSAELTLLVLSSALWQVCGGAADAENLQLCDTCDRGCHVACGKLCRVPGRAGWHCPGCFAAAGKAGKAGSRLHKAGVAARQLDEDSEDDDFRPAKASAGLLGCDTLCSVAECLAAAMRGQTSHAVCLRMPRRARRAARPTSSGCGPCNVAWTQPSASTAQVGCWACCPAVPVAGALAVVSREARWHTAHPWTH